MSPASRAAGADRPLDQAVLAAVEISRAELNALLDDIATDYDTTPAEVLEILKAHTPETLAEDYLDWTADQAT